MVKKITHCWYQPKPCLYLWLLWPLSQLYSWLVLVRRFLYKQHIFFSYKLNVPTVIIGNITVGGTGKTPVVIYLVELLKKQGLNPGVISRGYKGQSKQVTAVTANSDSFYVGDEPVLIAKRTGCPVVIGKNRVAAGRYLLKNFAVDIIICDDGLQHYALDRNIEIIVIDGVRRFGNGHCLPMGPLRELPTRLASANFVLVNGGEALPGEFSMQLSSKQICNLDNNQNLNYKYKVFPKVHAVAGIGDPNKFFNYLKTNGLEIIPHDFPDHHKFSQEDLNFGDGYPIIMTEKDAVKCQQFACDNAWFLPIDAILPIDFDTLFLQLLNKVKNVR